MCNIKLQKERSIMSDHPQKMLDNMSSYIKKEIEDIAKKNRREDMPKKTILLSDKAFKVYDSVKPHEKSQFVSEAIIERHEAETGVSVEVRLGSMEARLKKLENESMKHMVCGA